MSILTPVPTPHSNLLMDSWEITVDTVIGTMKKYQYFFLCFNYLQNSSDSVLLHVLCTRQRLKLQNISARFRFMIEYIQYTQEGQCTKNSCCCCCCFSFRNIKDREYELDHSHHESTEGSYLNGMICESAHSFIQHLLSSYYVQDTVLFHEDNVRKQLCRFP